MSKYRFAVVTRADSEGGGGNMATAFDVFHMTREPGWNAELTEYDYGQCERLPFEMLLNLRTPVFHVGEILILAESGRELGYPGRKPSKWDVDVEYVDTLEEAVALADKVMYPEAQEATNE